MEYIDEVGNHWFLFDKPGHWSSARWYWDNTVDYWGGEAC